MTLHPLLAACALAAAALPAGAQPPPLPPGFTIVQPASVKWTVIPGGQGAQIATLYGDSSKPGLYVVRVRFPPHVMDMPHAHTKDRHVTVIEGVWFAGTGPNFDPAKAQPLAAGGYMFHPAGGLHWDGAAGEGGAVVQIIGEGPVATEQRHAPGPDWVKIPRVPTEARQVSGSRNVSSGQSDTGEQCLEVPQLWKVLPELKA